MKVLYCASEASPIVKVGGLGDVAGSLPKALEKLGVEISVVVPKYEDIDEKILRDYDIKILNEMNVEFDGKDEKVIIWQTKLPDSGVLVYLLENKTYLSKDGHQAFRGNQEEINRFAFFSKSIAKLLSTKNPLFKISPDLLHLNDWHTSLIPLLLTKESCLPTLLTIHNLSYQGIGSVGLVQKLGLFDNNCKVLKWDSQNRDIDILMEGIIHVDYINTVSPTYAKEITTREYGEGMEEILRGREGRVVGILNGIDIGFWNPEKDSMISKQYTLDSVQSGKSENKKFLQKELGLPVNEHLPLLAFVGRMEKRQKGIDILYEALGALEKGDAHLPASGFQFILLATGDKEWEEKFNELAMEYQSFKFIPRFDEKLAHQIYAGADTILIPSRFEPCGLPQMIAMRYGTLPLVRKTGGLADTVVDGKTGFVFEEYSAKTLEKTMTKTLEKFRKTGEWQKMVREAMRQDFSWNKSAQDYLDLYKKILQIV